MKKYTRADFIKLPANTIYSRVSKSDEYEICNGLFLKASGDEYKIDWVEQDLISEGGFPNGITNGWDAIEYVIKQRNEFKDFELDLECGGRDGMFEDSDEFVVYDKKDIQKLITVLSGCLNNG